MRSTADVSCRSIFEPQLAHLPTQLALEASLDRRRGGRCSWAKGLIVLFLSVLLCNDGLGYRVQALTRPDLVDQACDFLFGIVEDGLDESLEGRAACLEVFNVLLVDAFAPVVRVRIVYARRVIDGGTC